MAATPAKKSESTSPTKSKEKPKIPAAKAVGKVSKERFVFKEYFHYYIRREFIEDRLKDEGDFLIRKSNEQYWVVSVMWKGTILHFQPHFSGSQFSFGSKMFDSFDDLIHFHYSSGEPIGQGDQKAILVQPIKQEKATFKMDDVEVLGKLGNGSFGEVFRVNVISLNKECAMKTLKGNVDKQMRENFVKEMAMMISMKHKNIVGCLGTLEDPSQVKILMELINKGSLDKLLLQKKLTDSGKIRVLADVTHGMEYVHNHNIIHRDLAARNILIHRNQDHSLTAKVSDFGLSRTDSSGHGYELRTAMKLPMKWMAPECFNERCWTFASDVWSFGVLMWEVWSNGKDPYSDVESIKTADDLTKFIASGGHPSDLPKVSANMQKIMSKCWTADQSKRPSMKTLARIFEQLYQTLKD